VMAQFHFSAVFRLFFFVSPACSACRWPVLFISDQFLHFLAGLRQFFFFLVIVFWQNFLVSHVFVVGD
jgi:hypothetical protein